MSPRMACIVSPGMACIGMGDSFDIVIPPVSSRVTPGAQAPVPWTLGAHWPPVVDLAGSPRWITLGRLRLGAFAVNSLALRRRGSKQPRGCGARDQLVSGPRA